MGDGGSRDRNREIIESVGLVPINTEEVISGMAKPVTSELSYEERIEVTLDILENSGVSLEPGAFPEVYYQVTSGIVDYGIENLSPADLQIVQQMMSHIEEMNYPQSLILNQPSAYGFEGGRVEDFRYAINALGSDMTKEMDIFDRIVEDCRDDGRLTEDNYASLIRLRETVHDLMDQERNWGFEDGAQLEYFIDGMIANHEAGILNQRAQVFMAVQGVDFGAGVSIDNTGKAGDPVAPVQGAPGQGGGVVR